MKTLLLIGLIFLTLSCVDKQTQSTGKTDSLKQSVATKLGESDNAESEDNCHEWLTDSTLSTGDFLIYNKENGTVKIEWGNKSFKRTLKKNYDCDAAPSWIPTIEWATKRHIGLDYSCGSPCWGTIILPLNRADSVVERMYDFERELDRNLIVYLGGDDYDKLIIENWVTGQRQEINIKMKCESAFFGYCIDSLKFVNDKLYIRWDESAGQNTNSEKRVDLIRLEM